MFECFDPELPDESISQYLKQGYYAFQDYAALHWVDHLEISIPFLNLDIFDDADNIGTAINEFYGMYVESKLETDVVSEELRERCSHLKDTGYLERLLSLVNHARKSRTADEMVTALGDVGRVLSKSRLLLEQQHSSANVTGEEKGRLKEYYGDHWNKCPRHACYYFHEGFSDVIRRDNHVSRHEKPFCCTELSCPRIHLGFSTEKELKKHMNINHPDPAAFAWRFPKVKKPPQKYTCKKCDPPKEYTRAHNLNIHMRTHENRRPYACQFCTRAFVRKYDYQRHMQVLHRDKKEQVMESSLETLVGSDKTDSEVGTSELVSSMSSDTLVGMAPGNITPM
jgi:hypothetical protein